MSTNGTVYMGKTGVWYGRYYKNCRTRDGAVVRKQVRVKLGIAETMNEAQARSAMFSIVQRERAGRARIGGLVASTSELNDGDFLGAHKVKGPYAEAIATADLLRRGYEVFRPVNPICPFDLLAWRDGQSIRVEVKFGKLSDTHKPICDFHNQIGQFDTLLLVTAAGAVYYFDADAICPKAKRDEGQKIDIQPIQPFIEPPAEQPSA